MEHFALPATPNTPPLPITPTPTAAPVSIAAGRAATVKLKLSMSARRKLSRKGTKVTLELMGRHVSVTATVKRR